MSRRRFTARLTGPFAAGTLAAGLLLAACGSPGSSSSSETTPATSGSGSLAGASGSVAATGEPIPVGIVTSLSGPLQSYGQMYLDAFNVCLDHATDGTGAVNGRPIEVATADDAGDPAKATTAATDYIGQGYKIIAGSASSGVALQVAPLAAENHVLFISGPAATDGLTGLNKYTFRSGRQTYQDIQTAASFIGDLQGKKVTIFAQDSAFGQANVTAASAVFGAEGATVTPLLVPATATDLVPFAKQAADAAPDLLFVAWAGTNATQMWEALGQQGAFDGTTVVTGLDIKPTHTVFAPVADKLSLLAHYFDGATDNPVEQAMVAGLQAEGKTQDLF
ncbi:MAG TPA: ABC transporter substrate-binding protein, partial [Nakamurella sp.]